MDRRDYVAYRMYKERKALMRKVVVRQLEVLFDLEDYLMVASETGDISTKLSEAYDSVEEAFSSLRKAREQEVADAIRTL